MGDFSGGVTAGRMMARPTELRELLQEELIAHVLVVACCKTMCFFFVFIKGTYMYI